MDNYPFRVDAEFPSQLVSDNTKRGLKWQKDSIDGTINRVLFSHDLIRKSKQDKIENYNIVLGKYDPKKIARQLNPMLLDDDEYDNDVKDLFDETDGLAVLKNVLDTLVGEQLKRSFDPRAYVTNAEAVSMKERIIRERISQFLIQKMQAEQINDEELQKEIEELIKWKQYGVQTIHEKLANNVLQHYMERLRWKNFSSNCYKDLVIGAEEIAMLGIANGEPYWLKCNPMQVLYKGNGQSNRIEDSTMILHWEYYNMGTILREFRNLTFTQIKELEEYSNYIVRSRGTMIANYEDLPNVLLPIDDLDVPQFGFGWFDKNGNILVLRVQWMSQRKIGILKYIDEFGNEQQQYVHEFYKADESKGESIEWIWIPEWWSGVKIGANIYTDIKPNPVQFRSMTNPAECKPMYRGIVSNINNGKAFSIIDTVKSFAYEYVVYAKKLKHLWLTNYGRVANIDLASIPNGMMDDGEKWDVRRWFNFIRKHRVALRNSFQEDGRGHIAGNMQGGNSYIDMSAAQEIEQILTYLNYLENMISRLSGISPQRQGNISPNEQVGNAQQAVSYSATQTEWLFRLHDEFQIEFLRGFLEVAKYCLKDKKELRQAILDDAQIALLEFDGATFNEADYDVQITNSTKVAELESLLKTDIISRAVQGGTVNLSDVAMLMLSHSPTSMIEGLKSAEERKRQESVQIEQQKVQIQQQALQVQVQMKQMEHQFKLEEIRAKAEVDMQLKQMELQDKAKSEAFKQFYTDANNNGIEDNIELEKQQLINDDKEAQRKFDQQEADKQRDFEAKQNELDRQNDLAKTKKKQS